VGEGVNTVNYFRLVANLATEVLLGSYFGDKREKAHRLREWTSVDNAWTRLNTQTRLQPNDITGIFINVRQHIVSRVSKERISIIFNFQKNRKKKLKT
jgi:hypothetical protein